MAHIINEPSIPFVGPIKGGLEPGTMVRIQGKVPEDGDRFNINLHCGAPPSDIALHVSVRLLQNYIARNSFEDGDWGDEEDSGQLLIAPGQHFEILLLCDPGSYKIAVNGNHFCEFRHRIPFKKVSHLEIDGSVIINLLAYESITPMAAPQQLLEGDPNMPPPYAPPPPPPPPGNYGYGPQQGPNFGGGPGQYPHDKNQESGFESFLGNAGTAIASAMVSGLAENLLGGLTGSGGQGRQQQQSQYQQQQPPPQNPMFNQGGQYNQGGGQNQGGGSIVNDILGSLASELFKPSRRN